MENALSQTMVDETHGNQQLTFMLSGEEYGVDILQVQEVKSWIATTPIPGTPDYILGVINLRGTIVPVVDLRIRFGADSVKFNDETVIIVVRVNCAVGNRTVGMVADAISEVYDLNSEDMKPPPDFGTTVSINYVRSLVSMPNGVVILLDVDKLISESIFGVIDQQADSIEVSSVDITH